MSVSENLLRATYRILRRTPEGFLSLNWNLLAKRSWRCKIEEN